MPAALLVLAAVLGASRTRAEGVSEPGFEALAAQTTETNHPEMEQKLTAWTAAHQTHPDAGRALIYVAQLHLGDGQEERAVELFRRTVREYPGSNWAKEGLFSLAQLDVAHNRFKRPLRTFELMRQDPNPKWAYLGEHGLTYAKGAQLRFGWFIACAAMLALWIMGRLALTWRRGGQLWPPPPALSMVLPVLVVMLAATFAQPPPEAVAVRLLTLGGAALLWTHDAYFRNRPVSRALAVREGAIGVLQLAALLYCAIIVSGLWVRFAETLATGAE